MGDYHILAPCYALLVSFPNSPSQLFLIDNRRRPPGPIRQPHPAISRPSPPALFPTLAKPLFAFSPSVTQRNALLSLSTGEETIPEAAAAAAAAALGYAYISASPQFRGMDAEDYQMAGQASLPTSPTKARGLLENAQVPEAAADLSVRPRPSGGCRASSFPPCTAPALPSAREEATVSSPPPPPATSLAPARWPAGLPACLLVAAPSLPAPSAPAVLLQPARGRA